MNHTIAQAVAEMLAILEAERDAIHRFDDDEVIRAARAKQGLADRLREASREDLAANASALATLLIELRRNASLLLYARACLRETHARLAKKAINEA
ncbi:MAG: hypothetical protein KF819_08645 [Labilithrix sp.]|nr:hypothetical protein [Labilithrix sp.]